MSGAGASCFSVTAASHSAYGYPRRHDDGRDPVAGAVPEHHHDHMIQPVIPARTSHPAPPSLGVSAFARPDTRVCDGSVLARQAQRRQVVPKMTPPAGVLPPGWPDLAVSRPLTSHALTGVVMTCRRGFGDTPSGSPSSPR